jgi:hypothetical protein
MKELWKNFRKVSWPKAAWNIFVEFEK